MLAFLKFLSSVILASCSSLSKSINTWHRMQYFVFTLKPSCGLKIPRRVVWDPVPSRTSIVIVERTSKILRTRITFEYNMFSYFRESKLHSIRKTSPTTGRVFQVHRICFYVQGDKHNWRHSAVGACAWKIVLQPPPLFLSSSSSFFYLLIIIVLV